MTYKVQRIYMNDHPKVLIESGLSLFEAQAHCANPETSSSKARGIKAFKHTEKFGPWFDSYDKE